MVFKITDYRVKLCATIVRMFICSSIWFKNVWMCVVCAETSSLILPRCDICFIFQIVHLLVCCVCVIVRQLHFSQALQTINWPLQLMNNLSLYFLLSLLLLFFYLLARFRHKPVSVCAAIECVLLIRWAEIRSKNRYSQMSATDVLATEQKGYLNRVISRFEILFVLRCYGMTEVALTLWRSVREVFIKNPLNRRFSDVLGHRWMEAQRAVA